MAQQDYDYEEGFIFRESVAKVEDANEAYRTYELDATNFETGARLECTNSLRAVMQNQKRLLLGSIELAKAMYKSGSAIRKACLTYQKSVSPQTEGAIQQRLHAVFFNEEVFEKARTLEEALNADDHTFGRVETEAVEGERKAERTKSGLMRFGGAAMVGVSALVLLDLFTTGGFITLSSVAASAAGGTAAAGGAAVVGEAGAAVVAGGTTAAGSMGASTVGKGIDKRKEANLTAKEDTAALVAHQGTAMTAGRLIVEAVMLLLESSTQYIDFCKTWMEKALDSTGAEMFASVDIEKFLTIWNVKTADVPHYIRS